MQIQGIINNTSALTTGKMPNNIPYGFTSWRHLNLQEVFPSSNTLAAKSDGVIAILFILLNQKLAYNWKYQPLFIKVDE